MSFGSKVVPTPQAQPGLMTVALFDTAAPRATPTPETPTPTEPLPDRPPSPTTDDEPASAPLLPPTPAPLDVVAVARELAVADPTAQPRPLSHAAASRPESAVTVSPTADNVSTCQLTDQLQARLANDPQVLAALARLPRDARSVANALMLWNGGWVGSDNGNNAQALNAIHASIAAAITNASPDCRNLPVLGPRLLSIPDASGATLLVIGSGEWRWDDLLRDPASSPNQPLKAF
ncbi:hypothetical protein BH10PSE4_BH10PSE4_05410 [soil metagenome]